MESSECGAACLKILLAYYGKYVPIEELRVACGVSRDGCTAYGIAKACEKYGMDCEGYSYSIEELKKQSFPCILHWGFNHFVVLEEIKSKHYYLNDPAIGHMVIKEEEFKKLFTGVALFLKPNTQFKRGGRKPGFFLSIWERLYPLRHPIFFLFGVQIILTIIILTLVSASRVFTDYILTGIIINWNYEFLLIVLAAIFLSILLNFLKRWTLVKAQIKLETLSSSQFFNHIFRLPLSFYEARYASEIAYRSTLNHQTAAFLTNHIFDASTQILMVGVYGIGLLLLSIPIALLIFLCASINIVMLFYVSKRRKNLYAQYRQEMGKSASFLISALEGFETWKCLGIENNTFSFLSSLYIRSFNALHALQNTDQLISNTATFSQALSNLCLFGFGGWMLLEGTLTPGQFTALLLLTSLFIRPVLELINIQRTFALFVIDILRLDDVIQHPIDPLLKQRDDHFDPCIELQNVTYRYNPNHSPILQNVSFTLRKGESVALVGRSGSGKTTMIKLIAGFIIPEAGTVKASVSKGFVFDTPFFFGESLKNNLTLFRIQIPNSRITESLQDARIANRFPQELYQEEIQEEGRNISGGEKQRLEIARCLLENPSFVILDEATSALDDETEREILMNIRKKGCGMLILTHRLSAIDLCDYVYVIDQGKIIQTGTPQELREKEGLFKEMLIQNIAVQ